MFLDDIIVMDRTFIEHLKNLAEVLQLISMASLQLNVKKSAFFQKKKVKYVEHLVTADDISTKKDKIRAVRDFPRPQNLHELRRFLVLCAYYIRILYTYSAQLCQRGGKPA